jgi:hypothetical protein
LRVWCRTLRWRCGNGEPRVGLRRLIAPQEFKFIDGDLRLN